MAQAYLRRASHKSICIYMGQLHIIRHCRKNIQAKASLK